MSKLEIVKNLSGGGPLPVQQAQQLRESMQELREDLAALPDRVATATVEGLERIDQIRDKIREDLAEPLSRIDPQIREALVQGLAPLDQIRPTIESSLGPVTQAIDGYRATMVEKVGPAMVTLSEQLRAERIGLEETRQAVAQMGQMTLGLVGLVIVGIVGFAWLAFDARQSATRIEQGQAWMAEQLVQLAKSPIAKPK